MVAGKGGSPSAYQGAGVDDALPSSYSLCVFSRAARCAKQKQTSLWGFPLIHLFFFNFCFISVYFFFSFFFFPEKVHKLLCVPEPLCRQHWTPAAKQGLLCY